MPLAHRGLHDVSRDIAENSRASFSAAIAAGYGIECDVQLAADGEAMVFHDHDLARLTGRRGSVHQLPTRLLAGVRLLAGGETIPTLADMLAVVAGRAPLLLEIKDQDGRLGPNVGPLETRLADLLGTYAGPVAVMSFNPHSVAAFAQQSDRPVGLTTCDFNATDWPMLSPLRRNVLAAMSELAPLGATFISHDKADLSSPMVAKARGDGRSILCWTIKSAAQESEARKIADNITFEGYAASAS